MRSATLHQSTTRLLYVLIALGTAAGLYGAGMRYRAEALNRATEITLDYEEVSFLAEASGVSASDALRHLKAAGATSVAVTEETIGQLDSAARIRPETRGSLTGVVTSDAPTTVRIREELQARGFPAAPVRGLTSEEGTLFGGPEGDFFISAPYAALRNVGVGLDPRALYEMRLANLQPVARIANFEGVSAAKISAVTNRLKSQGIKTVIFQGTEVLGFRGLHKETAQALDAAAMNFGWIEFGKQKGEDRLGAALDSRYVRVHSISETELGTLSEMDVLDRFVKAGRERNIRLLYVRLPNRAGDDPIEANAQFLRKLTRNLFRGDLLRSGIAHPFSETGVPSWAFLLMALGTAAGLTLMVSRFADFSTGALNVTLALSALICAGLVMAAGESGRKVVALLAAIVFPTVACIRRDILRGPEHSEASVPAMARGHAASKAISGLAAASAITGLGIAHVVGLLATRPFLVKTQQFMGIKAAHALPLLLIGFVAIVGIPRLGFPWQDERERMRERISRILAEPTRVGQVIITLVTMAVLLIIVARTGNEPGVGVSGIEMKFRSILDRAMGVRPRTKEFLLGHPAFVLGLALWFRGRRRIGMPLFVVGVLGQVSILNTFCHIHTPLMISAIRDVTGLVLGAVIGLAAFFFIEAVLDRRREGPRSEQSPEPAAALTG